VLAALECRAIFLDLVGALGQRVERRGDGVANGDEARLSPSSDIRQQARRTPAFARGAGAVGFVPAADAQLLLQPFVEAAARELLLERARHLLALLIAHALAHWRRAQHGPKRGADRHSATGRTLQSFGLVQGVEHLLGRRELLLQTVLEFLFPGRKLEDAAGADRVESARRLGGHPGNRHLLRAPVRVGVDVELAALVPAQRSGKIDVLVASAELGDEVGLRQALLSAGSREL
jgi:hypothetical protein